MAAARWKARAEYLDRELMRIGIERARLDALEKDYSLQLATALSRAEMWRRRAEAARGKA
jgi:hypothetical protein